MDRRKLALSLLLLPLLALFAACSETTYHVPGKDDDVDLKKLAPAADDFPAGIAQQQSVEFDNDKWAELFTSVEQRSDPDRKKTQLEAQGRVRNQVTFFSWENPIEHLGRPRAFEAHSTLYVDEKAASASMKESACGLLVPGDESPETLHVRSMAQETTAFLRSEKLDPVGQSYDVVICFRTGRIVHSLVQSGLDGTQDMALSIQLARVWLAHIDSVLN